MTNNFGKQFNLSERVALVTGGSRGIGRAICLALAECGAHVVINYASNEAEATNCQQMIENAGGSASLLKFDVANKELVDRSIKDLVRSQGRLDILINNAGVSADGLAVKFKEDNFAKIMDTNLKGAMQCSAAAALAMMKNRWGRIINISSVVGQMGNAGQSIYSASKAGMIGYTKAVAKEMASRGVTVNVVAPGFIDTDMTRSLPDKAKDAYLSSIPTGRFGEASEVASSVAFLSSNMASYITGQVIGVNGGLYI